MKFAIARIWARPADNHARRGTMDSPDHPRVRELAETMESDGLLEPIMLRPLPPGLCPPAGIVPDGPTHQDRLVVFGFRRLVAAISLGWVEIEAIEKDLDDRGAMRANLIENLVREDPTDHDVAEAFAALKTKCRMTPDEIAERVYGVHATSSRHQRVENLIRIVERCPRRLLEIWRREPTTENRRSLERISRIEGNTVGERHRAMIDAWAADLAERDRRGPRRGRGAPKGSRAMVRSRIETYRDVVRASMAYEDPTTGALLPLEDELKRAIDAVLRHVAAPKETKSPLR